MKRICMLALLLLLFVSLAAGESETYRYNAETYAVTKYSGPGGAITVPAEWDGQKVKALALTLFYNNDDVTELTLSEGIEALRDGALAYMRSLTALHLPETLRYIGLGNIQGLYALKEVIVPSSVSYIGNNCFNFLDALESVTFLGEAPFIGELSFSNIPDSTVFYVPDDCVDAYRQCLPESASIQPSGKNAVRHAFLTDENVFDFDASTGTVTGYHGSEAIVTLPRTIGGTQVRHIGEGVFRKDNFLSVILLPEGLESIGKEAFADARFLVHVDCPDTVTLIDDGAFNNGFHGSSFDWSRNLKSIGDLAFRWANSLSSDLILPEGLTSIGEEAFTGMSYVDVYLPSTIEHIGRRAFADSFLHYLSLPVYEMRDFAEDAFVNTSSFEDLDLPWDASLETLRTFEAFLNPQAPGCHVWLNNPPDVDYVSGDYLYTLGDDDMFYLTSYQSDQEALMLHYNVWDNSGEERVTKPVAGLGDGVFKGNQTLKLFRVTHSFDMTKIGKEAFADSSIVAVDLFYSIEEIGEGAFRNCKNLEELVLPASVKYIGDGAFDGCDALKSVTVLCDAGIVPDDAFVNCPALMEHPEGITFLPDADPDAVRAVRTAMGLPWYDAENLILMPCAPDDAAVFDFDPQSGMIRGYLGTDADVVVPREIDGVAVRGIARNAFEACRDYTDTDMVTNRTSYVYLRSLVLPETVQVIEDGAFSYLQHLSTFICYAPLDTTGRSTFAYCRSLNHVIFPNGCDVIDNYAFDHAGSLETFWNPHTVSRIGTFAFSHCALREAVVNALELDYGVFSYCNDLESIHFSRAPKTFTAVPVVSCPSLCLVCLQFTSLSSLPPDGFISQVAPVLTVQVPADTDEENCARAGQVLVWGSDTKAEVLRENCTYEVSAPDITAILTEYEQNPYLPPQAEPTSEPAKAEPAGPEGEPYLGSWYVAQVILGDTTYAASDFGVEATFTLYADGTCQMVDPDGESIQGVWSMTDGNMNLMGERLEPQEDGSLLASSDGIGMVFLRLDEDSIPAQNGPGKEGEPFVGTWRATQVRKGGLIYHSDQKTEITLHADGTCLLLGADGDTQQSTWSVKNGAVSIMGKIFEPHEDGTLTTSLGDTELIFIHVEEASPVPSGTSDEDRQAYSGSWHLVRVGLGDTIYAASDLGMEMELLLDPDGTFTLHGPEHDETGTWSIANGTLDLSGTPFVLQEDGTLSGEDEGIRLVFEHGAAADLTPAGREPYIGTWYVTHVTFGETTYAASELGMEIEIILHEDGTCLIHNPESEEHTGTWSPRGNVLDIDGTPFTLQEDGTLSGEEDGIRMVFAHKSETAALPSEDMAFYSGTWLVTGVAFGDTMFAASELGTEIEIILCEDGTCVTRSPETGEVAGTWMLRNGQLDINGTPFTVQEDGTLSGTEDGIRMVFARQEEPDAAPGEEGLPFTGTWYATSVQSGGSVRSAAESGISQALDLGAEGQYTLTDTATGETLASGRWTVTGTGLDLGMVQLDKQEDGSLSAPADDMTIFYTRDLPAEATLPPTAEPSLNYAGTWVPSRVYVSSLDFDAADLGYADVLYLHPDGTYRYEDKQGLVTEGTYTASPEGIQFDGALWALQEDGSLLREDGVILISYIRQEAP